MSLQAVGNNTTFKGKCTTEKGNEYNKTNAMKYTCMTGGAAIGAVQAYGITKAVKENGDMIRQVVDGIIEVIKKLDPEFAAQGNGANLDKIQNLVTKGAKYGAWAILPLGALLIGLAAGSICDFALNKSRARQADKLAEQTKVNAEPTEESKQAEQQIVEEKVEAKEV